MDKSLTGTMKQILISILVIICSCNQINQIDDQITKEVENLNTIKKQTKFLIDIRCRPRGTSQ